MNIRDYAQEHYVCRVCKKMFYGKIDPSWPRQQDGKRNSWCLACWQKTKRKKRHPAGALPGQGLLFEDFGDKQDNDHEAQKI